MADDEGFRKRCQPWRLSSIIKITHEVEDVAEIFARLNQAGTRVKEADVVLALAAVRNPGWVREDYLPFRNGLEERGWDLDAGIFIRTMTGIGVERARLREVSKDFWNPENLRGVWKETAECITEVLKRLAEFGITSDELLPSTNSLIPLFVLHHQWRERPELRFQAGTALVSAGQSGRSLQRLGHHHAQRGRPSHHGSADF